MWALVVGSCSQAGEITHTTLELHEPVVTITLREFAFSPSEVVVTSGDLVAFRNVGTVQHDWTVLSRPVETIEQLSPDLVVLAVDVQPGATETQTLDLPPGTYRVICTVPGHFAAGMVGTLQINGSEGTGAR